MMKPRSAASPARLPWPGRILRQALVTARIFAAVHVAILLVTIDQTSTVISVVFIAITITITITITIAAITSSVRLITIAHVHLDSPRIGMFRVPPYRFMVGPVLLVEVPKV